MLEGSARAGLASAYYSSSSLPQTSPQSSGGRPSARSNLLLASPSHSSSMCCASGVADRRHVHPRRLPHHAPRGRHAPQRFPHGAPQVNARCGSDCGRSGAPSMRSHSVTVECFSCKSLENRSGRTRTRTGDTMIFRHVPLSTVDGRW
jgi:hypothetical protein